MNLKRISISFFTSIFSFFILICSASGYAFSKDRSFVLNHSISDSAISAEKSFFQNRPFSSGFSLHEYEREKSGNIPVFFVGDRHLVPYHEASLILPEQTCPVFDPEGSDRREGLPRRIHRERTRYEPNWFIPRASVTNERDYVRKGNFSSPMVQRKLDYRKASIIAGLNVAAITAGFYEAINAWGESKGKFHTKNDWKGDGLAQTDEVSHFMWGYKMTQFFYWTYEWVGFSPKTSRTLSLCESSLILTLVEYPVDAYNPKQGLGVSDLIFDYLGVGMALAKKHHPGLNDFDFKLSWKKNVFSENQTVFAQTYEEFDNFIYWLTYRTKLFFPKKLLCFGLGYSATRSGLGPRREFYGGIGLSVPDFASLFGKRVGDFSKFLEILYPNIHIKF